METSLVYHQARLSYLSRKTVAEQLLEAENETEIVGILVEQASRADWQHRGVILHRYENDLARLVPKRGKRSKTGKLTHGQPLFLSLGIRNPA